jgi:hypothetical protein
MKKFAFSRPGAEIPIFKSQITSNPPTFMEFCFLGFWLLFGYWCLGFGA